MWGPAILVSPILNEGQTTLNVYFPLGYWYDYYTGEKISSTGKENKRFEIKPMSKIPVHIRGGHILPIQASARNTAKSRLNPFTLKVALESDGRRHTSRGDLFWDDGESVDTFENGNYYYSKLHFIDNGLKMAVQHANDSTIESLHVVKIQILGSHQVLKYAYINNSIEFEVFKVGDVYEVRNLNLPLVNDFAVEFTEYKNPTPQQAARVDCYPDIGGDSPENECRRRGCIWDKSSNPSVPSCYIDNTKYGYRMINNTATATGSTVDLEWKNQSQMFVDDISRVRLEIYEVTDTILRLNFFDPVRERYQVPINMNTTRNTGMQKKYNVSCSNDDKGMFSVQIKRIQTGHTIWDTSIGGLTFANQFLQLATKPSIEEYLRNGRK